MPAALLIASASGVGDQFLPPFTPSSVVTQWGVDPLIAVPLVWVAGLYLTGVWVLHRRGVRWPLGRTLAFVGGGVGTFWFATMSGLGTYDTTLLSVHMEQHMLLTMVAPLFAALGAPVTLALRTLPRGPRAWLLAVLHSRAARVLTFPPLTLAVFVASPWVLYFSGWYPATLHSEVLHAFTHLHLAAVGALFFWPLVGVDPLPGRVPFPFRMLLIFLSLPFHAFLGVTIMGSDALIAGDWYRSLPYPWLPSPADDQHAAGGILWAAGDLIGVLFFFVLFAQWVRSSMREAAREDRRLDRLERATAPDGAQPGHPAGDAPAHR